MTSSRPYLIRGIYEWIVDNKKTPYLLVDAAFQGVVVAKSYIENDRIILNVSPAAAQDISLAGEHVSFSARFGGQAMNVFIPVMAVMAIYAKENGQGMMFADEDNGNTPDGNDSGKKQPKRPTLKVVK